jgi:uncharacterized protein YijF (DUF1287 family)
MIAILLLALTQTIPEDAWLRIDHTHNLATLYDGDDPLALYTLGKDPLPKLRTVESVPGHDEDRNGNGIVDRLDVLFGAKKQLTWGAKYIDRYVSIPYPNGDVPRSEGVCSDTVIRALREAGLDLQREVHEDILKSRAAYPMVEKVDTSINHRRVHTLVPWFERHWQRLPADARFLPGDVVFFDTFRRKQSDHLGIVSDRAGETGMPLIINHWTVGTTDAEMDLLPSVPVTHHFRWAKTPPTTPRRRQEGPARGVGARD